MMRLRDLKGLGPKSERDLLAVGIETVADLEAFGPIPAFLRLRENNPRVSLNFLYALVGAVKGEHWLTIARQEKSALLNELEGYAELQKILAEEGLSF